MVRIFIDNKEIVYKDWKVRAEGEKGIMFTVTDDLGKDHTYDYNKCRIEPMIVKEETLYFDKKKNCYIEVESITEVGDKYYLIKYLGNNKLYIFKKDQITLYKPSQATKGDIFDYFKRIAQERLDNARNKNEKVIAQNVVSQFHKIVSFEGTALHAFISKKTSECEKIENLIFPFGINETQMQAVKNAFSSQLSIIEGPPGTGKTQTILNIIANIIVNGKTCAIISNNNSAVENVYEKLEKKGLGFLIAKLGKSENRESFFDAISYNKPQNINEMICFSEIKQLFEQLQDYLSARNRLAKVICEIQEIEIELDYLKKWNAEHTEIQADYISKYNLVPENTTDLIVYLKYLADRALAFKDKWELLIHYRIFRSKFLNKIQDRENFIFSLQLTYYEKILKEQDEEKRKLEQLLENVDFENTLKKLQEKSLKYLYQYVIQNMPNEEPVFTAKDYRKNFVQFIKYFPVIGSSTHSLVSSISDGYLLDYVIIDEASQQDLVPGVLCFGCAKNAIVVGDRKQLPHIAADSGIASPDPLFDCQKYSLLDSINEVFGQAIPCTLLKEHYRCHPKIIQFCNKQFYNDQLIPMTVDHGENALGLVITARGNHMRNYKNQREIESVLKVNETCGFLVGDDGGSVGFITPYNNQVSLAKDMMPEHIVKNTIHKFQGRECDRIIFSTVLDKKAVSQRQLDFVDNAPLVNVAVSRAKDEFILVTGNDVFTRNNKYIAALIRYIQYYAPDEDIYDSPVISSFDLLYSEYDKSLERLALKLEAKDSRFKSERIMAAVLREVLSLEGFRQLEFHGQIYLKQLVSTDKKVFSEREVQFINHRASCDFVLYYRIGKKPLAVIEVDGGFHEKEEQIKRDQLKNSILEKAGIPLLRLRTTDGDVEERVAEFLNEILAEDKRE